MNSFFGQPRLQDPKNRALAGVPIATHAGPWRQVTIALIGGLTAIGFDRRSEDLLVTSMIGQSVISGLTGEVLYRNRDNDGLDIDALKGTRLDHPGEERFDMAGIYGGGLRTMTSDGWNVERLPTTSIHCILTPPRAPRQYTDTTFHLLAREEEDVRAFGFSWSGRSLALATATELKLWSRPSPLTL